MPFADFLNQAWRDHASNPAQVAASLKEGISQIEKNEQIPLMANLVTHVMGEHLGQWNQGVQLLQVLKKLSFFDPATESQNAIVRSIASLEVASGDQNSLEALSVSDRVRVLAVAASALSEQKVPSRAQQLFRQCLELAQTSIPKDDPANRALAITSNNLACALEEKEPRSKEDTELMIRSANTARKYWAIAGGWMEVERAEYRLAQTYLKANELAKALEHAQKCLEVSTQNNAPVLELFFGYEVLALVEKARGNKVGFSNAIEQVKSRFDQLPADEKSWCEASLKKLL